MGGGRFGQTISAIAKLAPASVILQGLDVEYSDYDRDRIHTWLDAIKTHQQTSVRTVRTEAAAPAAVYSLDGRRVAADASRPASLPSGIYIVNGEKRIVK